MNATAAAIIGVAAIIGMVAFWVWQGRRQGAALAQMTALAHAEAETIKSLKAREALDEAVNADPDLAERAAKWVRPVPRD